MSETYNDLSDQIKLERDSYGKDLITWFPGEPLIRISSLPDVPNQCVVFADGLEDRLQKAGYKPERVYVKTPGSKELNHVMVKVDKYYMDNNSYFPYMHGCNLFDDLYFYDIEGKSACF
jgi:hypothetical protein